jgi:hypothetical protein
MSSFEERISQRARSFDLKPLVELLLRRGYRREQLLFQSNREGGATSLVHAVEFRRAAKVTILITLNLGLLGDNALLPSYFVREIEHSRDPERFYDFIRFFDHCLLDNYLRAAWPEDDPCVYGDYAFVQDALLKLAGFGSVSSLHWFFQRIFPELRVRVARHGFADATASHACRTGQSKLDGSAIIGRLYESEAQGFLIELVTEDETDDAGRSWAFVLRERLAERVLPVLAPFRVPLVVVLIVLAHESWAQIEATADTARGYLGYDRIRGDPETEHRVVLYRGIAKCS